MTKRAQVDIILIGDHNNITEDCIESINRTSQCNIIVEPFDGYNKSLNEGAKKGSAKYIAFCNNDLIFHVNWLIPLIDALDVYDSVSPWCPSTHDQWWKSVTPVKNYSSYEVGKCIAGWFIMMKRETWEKIGGFDERFEFWYADNSYGEQLKNLKLRHALIPASKVTHLQSTTLKTKSSSKQKDLTHDQRLVFEKYYGRNKR